MEVRRREPTGFDQNTGYNQDTGYNQNTGQNQNRRLDLPDWQTDRTAPTYQNYSTEYYGSKKSRTGITGTLLTVAGGLALAVAGGTLAWRGFKNRKSSSKGVNAHAYITVDQSPEEVYSFWRQLSNLPLFMNHLKEVREMDAKHSHWVAKFPGNLIDIEWDAEILDEEPGRFIAWRSLPDADVENSGEVRFEPAPNSGGTIVHAIITYTPPVGVVGDSLSGLFNPAFEKTVQNDLRNFKKVINGTGETTMAGEPAARKAPNRTK